MQKLGLIGGIGPESSIVYYRLIIKRFQEKLNTKEYPEIVINSINNTEMLSYVFNNKLDKLVDFLSNKIETLALAGADFAAIASNTPHIVFDKLTKRTKLPLISIVTETCKEISKKKLHCIGLLGTKSTMSNGFYEIAANNFGIQIITPNAEDQNYIHEKYMTELLFNNIKQTTKKQLIQIVKKIKENNYIEGLILGGTELPLILSQDDFNDIVLYDTLKIHTESIVERMIAKKKYL
jgi:aspartate racemase